MKWNRKEGETETHKSSRGEIAESGLIVPGRDNKACNHLSLLHRTGNYLPIPDRQNRKGKIHLPSPYHPIELQLLRGNSCTDASWKQRRRKKETPGVLLILRRSVAGIVFFHVWNVVGWIKVAVWIFHLVPSTHILTHTHNVSCQYITSDKRRVATH